MRYMCVLALASTALAACSSGTGPAAPPATVTGVWSSTPPQSGTVLTGPGGPDDFVLSQSGDSVTGTGQILEFTFHVAGTYVRPEITLVLTDTMAGRVSVDTLAGHGENGGRLVLGGTTYYKQ